MRSQRGSSSIESLVSLALLFGVTTSGGGLAYASFTRLWCERVLREAAVCLQASEVVQPCETQARLQLESVLPASWNVHKVLRLTRTSAFVRAELRIQPQWISASSSIGDQPHTSVAAHRPAPSIWYLQIELPRSWPESRRTHRRSS